MYYFRLAAKVENMLKDYDDRVALFEKELGEAFRYERKKCIFVLERIRNEMNGYYIEIHAVLKEVRNIKKNEREKEKLKKIKKEINDADFVIRRTVAKIRTRRNDAAHKVCYQLNTGLFDNKQMIREVLSKAKKKMRMINEKNEIEIIKERKKQQTFLYDELKKYEKKEKKVS